jgi:rare lipoprotein A (peptidoglycan hydrolase)
VGAPDEQPKRYLRSFVGALSFHDEAQKVYGRMKGMLLAFCIAAISAGAQADGSDQRSLESHCGTGDRIIAAHYTGGGRTASGQRLDANGLTAAHRTFPFGTRLMVINPRNGKSVTVTINDRGPFVRGVTLDLSIGAAKVIGMHGTGAMCMATMGIAG